MTGLDPSPCPSRGRSPSRGRGQRSLPACWRSVPHPLRCLDPAMAALPKHLLPVHPQVEQVPQRRAPAHADHLGHAEVAQPTWHRLHHELRDRYGLSTQRSPPWGWPTDGIKTIWGWERESGLRPCRVYLRHCYLAAQSMGDKCFDSFLDETFLVDRTTTIREYIDQHPGLIENTIPPPGFENRYNG